jgi:flagellin
VQRLSSGLRIVGAQDDAAGLAVRELLRADVAALRQAARNAQDAVSMLQTGEGAMQVVDNILVRMRELAEQAANGTYTDGQRNAINSEFTQLSEEVDRIAAVTNFNGIELLNSASGTLSIQVGTANGDDDKITVNLIDVTVSGLGIDEVNLATQASAAAALVTIAAAIESKDSARASFGAKMNRLDASVTVLDTQAENLLAAESRISDVDVAKEMSVFARNQVLAQAGVAMMAQANAMPQMALSLLRG